MCHDKEQKKYINKYLKHLIFFRFVLNWDWTK
jgi:hypothetical protein